MVWSLIQIIVPVFLKTIWYFGHLQEHVSKVLILYN